MNKFLMNTFIKWNLLSECIHFFIYLEPSKINSNCYKTLVIVKHTSCTIKNNLSSIQKVIFQPMSVFDVTASGPACTLLPHRMFKLNVIFSFSFFEWAVWTVLANNFNGYTYVIHQLKGCRYITRSLTKYEVCWVDI